jgi:hypothetical protein
MSNLCESLIKAAITASCDNPIMRGMESDGVIINRADIDFGNCTVTGNTISALVLKTGKVGFPVYQMGNTPFTGTKVTMVAGTYKNKFQNEVVIAVLDNGPDVSAKVIDGLANGTFVVVLRNLHKGEDGKSEYQVFGYYQGLKASAIENDKYSEELDGGWLVTLQESNAPTSGMFFYANSAAATATAYEALTATT